MVVARSYSNPGRSSATISIKVAVWLAVLSKLTRDAILAFRLGGCTGLYHPYDGILAFWIPFFVFFTWLLVMAYAARTAVLEEPE